MTLSITYTAPQSRQATTAHFEKERWPGSRVAAQAIVGLFGGTITIAIVPPNNPIITWAVTLDPGHHSFSKWATGHN